MHSIRPLLILALTASTASAGVHLAYRLPAGSQFTMTMNTELRPPLMSAIRSTVSASVHVEAGGNPMRLRQVVRCQQQGRRAQSVTIRHTLSSAGQVAGLSGANMGDAGQAFLARSSANAVPALPDREVGVGDSWSEDHTFYVPPNQHVPDGQIPLRSTYTLRAVSGGVATLAVTTRGSARSIRVSYAGQIRVDVATGRPLSANITGTVTKSIRFLPNINMPLAVTMTSSGPRIASAAPATRIAVPGVYGGTLLGLR